MTTTTHHLAPTHRSPAPAVRASGRGGEHRLVGSGPLLVALLDVLLLLGAVLGHAPLTAGGRHRR